MILAHGPLGYLLAYAVRQRWPYPRWYYWFGASGGIFPDIDLFYYYLVDSSVSHHQLLTHSILPYIILLVIAWGIKPVRLPVMLFALGCISHVLADTLTGYVAIVSPLSDVMIGLPSWGYSFVANSTLEFIMIVLALGTFVRRKRTWFLISVFSTLVVGGISVWLNQHSYKPDGWFYYGDLDGDGVINASDRDLDGDQLVNMLDPDIDNDGVDNSTAFYLELFSADQALFDYGFGHPIEIPLRLGLVNDRVMVQRLFANSGLFMHTEMAHDYAARPAGYSLAPSNNAFAEQPSNVMTWLSHTNHLLPAAAQRQEFDVIFFQSGMMAVFTRLSDGTDVVFDVDASHPYARYEPYATVVEREGGVIAIGRVLPKPFAKRY